MGRRLVGRPILRSLLLCHIGWATFIYVFFIVTSCLSSPAQLLPGWLGNSAETNLTGANLSGMWWHNADLSGANLTGADLTGADLLQADLSGANLTGADLTGADLLQADLSGANLTGANLTGANLTGANLTETDLTGANLDGANLTNANLFRADLSGAKLYDVIGADFTGALNVPEKYLKD
jgi:uncharacterized protein YjbI with pentapeptide repeats